MKRSGPEYEIVVEEIFRAIHKAHGVNLVELQRDIRIPGTTTRPNGKRLRHQIDVLWKIQSGPLIYTTVIQAKNWKNKVSIGQVLQFHKIIEDIPGQPRGIIVTTRGFQSGALDYASEHGIELFQIGPALENVGLSIRLNTRRNAIGNMRIREVVYQSDGEERVIAADSPLIDLAEVVVTDGSSHEEIRLEDEEQRFKTAITAYLYEAGVDGMHYNYEHRKTYAEGSSIRFRGGQPRPLRSVIFSIDVTVKDEPELFPLYGAFEYYAKSLTSHRAEYYYKSGRLRCSRT
jgi:Restriction endonuclease